LELEKEERLSMMELKIIFQGLEIIRIKGKIKLLSEDLEVSKGKKEIKIIILLLGHMN